jgi:N-succinyldiaminopimelate aminotransferase
LQSVLGASMPDASFYLWVKTPIPDTDFARRLAAEHNVHVLPGSFLARQAHGVNPGADHARIALVAPLAECLEAADRIQRFVTRL